MARYSSLLTILLIALMAIIVRPAVSLAQWVEDGVPSCTATGDQWGTQLVSDWVGGAIITWMDRRLADNGDIYIQRVDSLGNRKWIVAGDDSAGVPICTATGSQWYPQLVSDGAGGAIIVWGGRDIYAQRVDALGRVLWDSNGVAICTAWDEQWAFPQLVSDGVGGAIITWQDYRNGYAHIDIYAQRVDASGTVQWDTNGVAICTATGNQENPQLSPDGAGGAIIVWMDYRSADCDLYAQRVDASGTVQWDTAGVLICTATGNQEFHQLVSDGAGGAITVWKDSRSGGEDIYAQKVDSCGAVQWDANGVPICTAAAERGEGYLISDLAGGAIIAWGDSRGGIYAQRVDASGMVQWATDGVDICMATGGQEYPQLVSDGAGGAIIVWMDYRSADCDLYAQRVDTSGSVLWDTNGVALCTATGDQEFHQLVSDGAGGAIITWEDYRSGHGDIYAQKVDHEGRAPPEGISNDDQGPKLPRAFFLFQNYPNPFNSTTLIRYHLPAVSCQLSAISLKIYNILGEEVRTLVEKEQVSGYYSVVWDGKDSLGKDVSSGVYLYRLEAGEFTATRRMVLLR